tara:strand:- start:649 stop:966 length:318 start_codon:yes stop_codon:yes gene_type:complete
MLLESFYLYDVIKQNQKLYEKYRYNIEGYQDATGLASMMEKFFMLMIILVLIVLGLYIWAIYDISKNCQGGGMKVALILGIIFIPFGLPLYGILRMAGVICNNQV